MNVTGEVFQTIITGLLGLVVGILAWIGKRQIRRLDETREMALSAATMAEVEEAIDRRVTEQIRDIREDIRELRTIIIRAVEYRD